jgi:hypothetical protein
VLVGGNLGGVTLLRLRAVVAEEGSRPGVLVLGLRLQEDAELLAEDGEPS